MLDREEMRKREDQRDKDQRDWQGKQNLVQWFFMAVTIIVILVVGLLVRAPDINNTIIVPTLEAQSETDSNGQ